MPAAPIVAAETKLAPAEETLVERLSAEAERAAADALFVYPPVDQPDARTTYRIVLELEAVTEDPEAARTAAQSQRRRHADTLSRLGDRYFSVEGGRPFAIDYYIQALLFDPDQKNARERVLVTPGELASLRAKASEGGFTANELLAVEALQVLATTDEKARGDGLRKLAAKRTGKRAATTEASLAALAGPTVDAAATNVPVAGVAPLTEANPVEPETEALDDRVRAAELVVRAREALKSGRAKEAEQLFHQALRAERHHADALVGLGDLYFERAAYAKSAKYRKLATQARPRDAELRIATGDAYFKSVRYEDALTHYRKAAELGHSAAASRIAKVEALTQ
jgi:tetratricopeptide (TPR) repeat protein